MAKRSQSMAFRPLEIVVPIATDTGTRCRCRMGALVRAARKFGAHVTGAYFWVEGPMKWHRLISARRFGGLLMLGALVCGCPRTIDVPHVSPLKRSVTLKGVGLGLFASRADYNYELLLDEIVDHGATDVLVVVPWYQQSRTSHEMAPKPGQSPSTQNVLRTLRQAKARGLRVSLLPIVRLVERSAQDWRGRIEPDAGVDVWFSTYTRFILAMAQVAEAAKIERLGVGSELVSMERHEDAWRKLIAQVRQHFTGKLYYSANWDHFAPIRFWDALDEVGVTGYFELAHTLERPTADQLSRAWEKPRFELARWKSSVQKPLIITEIGYPSRSSAARFPWDETRDAPLDLPLQADLYQAFCDSFVAAGLLDGFYFWNWFGFGGSEDGEYTPRGKPAADVLQTCLVDPRW